MCRPELFRPTAFFSATATMKQELTPPATLRSLPPMQGFYIQRYSGRPLPRLVAASSNPAPLSSSATVSQTARHYNLGGTIRHRKNHPPYSLAVSDVLSYSASMKAPPQFVAAAPEPRPSSPQPVCTCGVAQRKKRQ